MAFACALGSFNCLSTLSEQLTQPLGFSSEDASNFGVFTVASGIVQLVRRLAAGEYRTAAEA